MSFRGPFEHEKTSETQVVGWATGIMAAGIASNSTVFSLRWGSATRLGVIQDFTLDHWWIDGTAFTAGVGALAARLAGVSRIIFTAHGWPFAEKRNILC